MTTLQTGCLLLLAAMLTGNWACARNPISNGGFETVNADGTAPDWEFLGQVRTFSEATFAGRRSVLLVREGGDRGETGLNRAWEPHSGQQGAMLRATRGAIRFRYSALSEERPGVLTVQIIPMTEKPLEFGGHRTRWHVPAHHIGDGTWHEGRFAYDYSKHPEVKWVHVSARLLAPGALLLDAFEWVPDVGPVPYLASVSFAETPGMEGRRGTLRAVLKNLGNRPMGAGKARLDRTDGLSSTSPGISTPALAPGEQADLEWHVEGPRDREHYVLELSVTIGQQSTAGRLELRPDVALSALRTDRLLAAPGSTVTLELIAKNTGHTIVTEVPFSLSTPDGVRVRRHPIGVRLLPGDEAAVGAWGLTSAEAMPVARIAASAPNSTQVVRTHLVFADPGTPPESPNAASYAAESSGWHLVGSRSVRLAIFEVTDSVRAGFLQVRHGSAWQTAGMLPRLATIRTPTSDLPMRFTHVKAVDREGVEALEFSGNTQSADGAWQARCTLFVDLDGDGIGYRLEATRRGSDAAVSSIEGPMLHAGGELGERDDAILPGLEWLVRGEASSNALDIRPGHPDRIRYVPHPRKITVPAVGMRFGDIGVGMLWEPPPRQPSRKTAGALSLVFASPNRFEGQRNHLIGLILPGVDQALGENMRVAHPPWIVPAGESLRIEASLLAMSGVDDALLAVDTWIATRGVPRPLPLPTGSALGEIAFSLQAYRKDKALWNPEWGKWYSDIIVGFRPTTSPTWELLMGAALMGPGTVSSWARQLAADVLGCPVDEAERRLEARTSIETIRGRISRGHALAASQEADGNWAFKGEKAADSWPAEGVDYSKLGPAGAREIGLTAANARDVLEAALLSADPELKAAGLKALAAMRQFRVPRAAQVWEVPVHTPDILASARAVNTFLTGYQLTGDAACLADAVFWARTGLPFVYLWHEHDLPAMQGATIPVFGATGYGLSWFAVAVQWNGLAYSEALYNLAEWDHSYPWERIADNILRSAMYQQATEGDRLAQWPDAVNFIPGRPGPHGQTPPCFRPSTIINQTLRGMGIRRDIQNHALRGDNAVAVIRTAAIVNRAVWKAGTAQIDLDFTPPSYGTMALLHVDRPNKISVNGTPCPENTVLDGTEPCWRWLPRECVLEIRLPRPGKKRVLVEGLTPHVGTWTAPRLTDIDFEFSQEVAGWRPAHDLGPLLVRNDALQTIATGTDPYMTRNGFQVKGREGDRLDIEIALSPGPETTATAVYWGTATAPGFAASRTMADNCPADGEFHTVRIPVGTHDAWRDHTITHLRIDPLTEGEGTTVRIRRIRLLRGK